MATEIGRLIAVFEGNDVRFHATRKRVEAGARQTAKEITLSEKQQKTASESLQRQRSTALIAEWKRQEREAIASAKRTADAQIRESRRAANEQLKQAKRWAGITPSRGGGGVGIAGFAAGAAGGIAALVGTSIAGELRQGASAWFTYASSLEATRIAFTTMLGSSQAAEKHLKELQAFALKTPFEFSELVAASQRMQALGFTAAQVIPVLNSVGNAVAAAGGGSERLDRVVTAMSQIQSKGKVMTQELNQLAEAGIPAWKMMEEQFGKSRAELIKLVEQGKISAEVFLEAFQNFSQQKFGDMMEKQSKTAIGAISNLKDAVMQISERAFAPLFEQVRDGLLSISNGLVANQASWESWGRAASNSILGIKDTISHIAGLIIDLDNRIRNLPGVKQATDAAQKELGTYEENVKSLNERFMGTLFILESLRGYVFGLNQPKQQWETEGEFAVAGGAGQFSVGAGPSGKAPAKKATPFGGDSGRGGRAKRDVLEGLRSTLVSLNAEYRKFNTELLGSASASALATEKERLLADIMSQLKENTRLAVSTLTDVDKAIDKAIGSLPDKAQAAARALVEESLAQFKQNEALRIAGDLNKRAEELSKGWRLEIDRSRSGADEYATAIEDLERAFSKHNQTLDAGTKSELEHLAAMQRAIQITKELIRLRTVGDRPRRFNNTTTGDVLDLGSGSFFMEGGTGAERSRIASVEEQVARERLADFREKMQVLAADLTSTLRDATRAGLEGGLVAGFQSLTLGILQILENVFFRQLENMLTNALSGIGGGGGNWLTNSIGSLIGGFGGPLGGLFGGSGAAGGLGSAFAGSFASGGTIPMGKWGMVHANEKVVVGPAGAQVIPMGGAKEGSGNTYNYNINVPVRSAGSYSTPRSRRQLGEDIASALQGATT